MDFEVFYDEARADEFKDQEPSKPDKASANDVNVTFVCL
jgi:hypothetical protein